MCLPGGFFLSTAQRVKKLNSDPVYLSFQSESTWVKKMKPGFSHINTIYPILLYTKEGLIYMQITFEQQLWQQASLSSSADAACRTPSKWVNHRKSCVFFAWWPYWWAQRLNTCAKREPRSPQVGPSAPILLWVMPSLLCVIKLVTFKEWDKRWFMHSVVGKEVLPANHLLPRPYIPRVR